MAQSVGLNYRQRMFVREYMVDRNALQAYERAGYAPNPTGSHATRLMKNPLIKEAIAKCEREAATRVEVSVDWVLTRLRDEALNTGEDATAMSRLRALELLGKHIGMWPRQAVVAEGDDPRLVLKVPDHVTSVTAWREVVQMELDGARNVINGSAEPH